MNIEYQRIVHYFLHLSVAVSWAVCSKIMTNIFLRIRLSYSNNLWGNQHIGAHGASHGLHFLIRTSSSNFFNCVSHLVRQSAREWCDEACSQKLSLADTKQGLVQKSANQHKTTGQYDHLASRLIDQNRLSTISSLQDKSRHFGFLGTISARRFLRSIGQEER